jgi:hypothetical protein
MICHIRPRYAESHYAECRCADFRGATATNTQAYYNTAV